MERPHFAYSSVCQGTLGGFHLLAIVDRAAVNMGIWSSSYFSFPPFLKDEVLYLLLCFVLVFFYWESNVALSLYQSFHRDYYRCFRALATKL